MGSNHPNCAVFGMVEARREEAHNAVGLSQSVSVVILEDSKYAYHYSQWEGLYKLASCTQARPKYLRG